MKVKEFLKITEHCPFWGVVKGEYKVLVKLYDCIYELGSEVDIDPDDIEYLEPVKKSQQELDEIATEMIELDKRNNEIREEALRIFFSGDPQE